ncbi:MAG: Nif3-like dinuclear metal center hexameric protein [Lachnospiraceae bacterium]|nr:Nif3-like dinuclear metal center hexameric protein [Lachnospiraceae bacterium]
MELGEVIAELEQLSPPSFAEAWDNSGLMCGRKKKEIKSILLSVDATDEVVEEAVLSEADLLLTHHPLIFKSVSHITEDDIVGRRLLKLIRSDVACYAMHTNFDVMGMADEAADRMGLLEREVLEVTYEDAISKEGIGRVGLLPQEMTVRDCVEMVKEVFLLDHVKLFGDPARRIRKVAVSPGSGKGMIRPALAAGAEVLVTGDIGHHEGIDAVANGLTVIDGGHYGIEKIFVKYMKDFLRSRYPELEVHSASQKEPFIMI